MYPFIRTVLGCAVLAIGAHSASAAIIIDTNQAGSGSLGTVQLPGGQPRLGLHSKGIAPGGRSSLELHGHIETCFRPSGGQARITAVDGAFALTSGFAGGQIFDRMVFNLDASWRRERHHPAITS